MNKCNISAALALGLFAAAPALAQGPVFGVKGGLNYAMIAVDEADENKARIGFHGGLFGRTDPESAFGLQVEVLYSAKGAHATYNALGGLIDQEVDFNVNYLEVPVLASLRVADVLDIQLGPYAAFLLSAKTSTSGDLGNGSDDLDKDNFQSTDFGLAVGAALNAGTNLQVGARYTHGFAKLADSDAADMVLGDATNRCIQIYLGIGVGGN